MERLPHPDPENEKLIVFLEENRWETSQRDAHIRAECLSCHRTERFGLVKESVPASIRRETIVKCRCFGGDVEHD